MTIRYIDKEGHLKNIDVEWVEVVDYGICRATRDLFRFDEEKK